MDPGQKEAVVAVMWGLSFLVCLLIGLKKGEGMAMGLLALVFGPLAIPVAVLSRGNKLPCPWCGTKIPARAIYCKHCQHDVTR